MNPRDLSEEIKNIKWFHKIDLGNGIITPGVDESQKKLEQLQLDNDLTGKTVLDIGAWDGFFSFEAERRGASRVLAIDGFVWKLGGKDGFNLARKALGSNIEHKEMDVMDLCPGRIGAFDYVLFLGVFYHLRHPLLALEKISSITKNQLILETHGELIGGKRPAMVFYPGDEMNNDPTNWWGPNPSAITSMLKDVGFRKNKVHLHNTIFYKIKKYYSKSSTSYYPALEKNRADQNGISCLEIMNLTIGLNDTYHLVKYNIKQYFITTFNYNRNSNIFHIYKVLLGRGIMRIERFLYSCLSF